MKARLCNKCREAVSYPFYSISYKESPKKVKEKSRYNPDKEYEHTVYPSKPCADICIKCWKKFDVKLDMKTFDSVPYAKGQLNERVKS